MNVGKLPNHVNIVLCMWLFFFWRFVFSIFLFLTGLEFWLNSQHFQVYDDIWKLIILYPIDLRIIFSIFLLQPGPPSIYSWLRPWRWHWHPSRPALDILEPKTRIKMGLFYSLFFCFSQVWNFGWIPNMFKYMMIYEC